MAEKKKRKGYVQNKSLQDIFLSFSSSSTSRKQLSELLQIMHPSRTTMFLNKFLLLTLFTFVYSESKNCSNYYTCQVELYDRLVKNARPSLRPVEKDSKKINIFFGFSIIRLVSVVRIRSIRSRIKSTDFSL